MPKKVEPNYMLKGAFLLTLAALLTKILSAGYRIPLQNLTGDLGFYIYQQIYPFLGIAWMLSIYGFPVAISKLVAEKVGGNRSLTIRTFYLPVFLIMLSYCVVFFMLVYFGAEVIAEYMGDIYLIEPIRASAFIFLVIPFTALFRGVFQGIGMMGPTAISQVIEQFIRVIAIIITAILVSNYGMNFYKLGAGAALGSIIGASIATIILIGYTVRRQLFSKASPLRLSVHYMIKTMFTYGVLMCINYMMLLLFQLADAFTLIPKLQAYGMTLYEAQKWKGIFDRGQPLIQLGAVFGSSLALAIVPALTKLRLEQNSDNFQSHVKSAIKLTFLLSSGASIGLILLFPMVNTLLFKNDLGTGSLQMLSVVIVFASLAMTISSMLQGIGQVRFTIIAILAGLLLKFLLNLILVPNFGILGSSLASVAGTIVIFSINYLGLIKNIPKVKSQVIPWKNFGTASIYMCVVVILFMPFYNFFIDVETRLDYLPYVLLLVTIGGLTYMTTLIKTGAITQEELSHFPFSERIKMFF